MARSDSVPQFDYLTEPVDEFEDVRGVFYGGRGQVGQQYVVTNRRLLMGPIDAGIAQEIDAYILNQAVGGGGDLVKGILSKYAPMSPKTVWLRHVVDVQATNNARLLKPPGLRLTTDTDQAFDLGVVASATTMSISPKNNAARDSMVQVLREAVQAARAASAPSA
jgi:hypothetical protein